MYVMHTTHAHQHVHTDSAQAFATLSAALRMRCSRLLSVALEAADAALQQPCAGL